MVNPSTPSSLQALGFGAGPLGSTLASGVVPLLFLFYLTEFAQVPPALAGLLLAVPKIADVLLDPWLGRYTDQRARAAGSRAALIALSAVVLPALLVLLFVPLGGMPLVARALLIGLLLICKSLMLTVFSVAHTAIAGDISDSLAGRSTLMSARALGQTMAGLVISLLAPQIVALFSHSGWAGSGGYLGMACVLALAGFIALGACWISVRSVPLRAGVESELAAPLWTALRVTLRNRAFYFIVLILVLLGASSTALFAALPYANQHLLRAGPQNLSVLLTPIFMALLLGVASAPWIARRVRPLTVLAAALGMALLGLIWFAAGPRANVSMMAGGALFGVSSGALTVVVATLAMEAATKSSSQGESLGLYLGILFSAEKLGQSLGGIVVGLGLDWVGPLHGTPGADTVGRLATLFAGAPAAMLLLALLALVPLVSRLRALSMKDQHA